VHFVTNFPFIQTFDGVQTTGAENHQLVSWSTPLPPTISVPSLFVLIAKLELCFAYRGSPVSARVPKSTMPVCLVQATACMCPSDVMEPLTTSPVSEMPSIGSSHPMDCSPGNVPRSVHSPAVGPNKGTASV